VLFSPPDLPANLLACLYSLIAPEIHGRSFVNWTLRSVAGGTVAFLEVFCLLDLYGGVLLAPVSFSYKVRVFIPLTLLVALCLACIAALLLNSQRVKGQNAIRQILNSSPLVIWYVATGSLLLIVGLISVNISSSVGH
jgi:hypothetical protein